MQLQVASLKNLMSVYIHWDCVNNEIVSLSRKKIKRKEKNMDGEWLLGGNTI